MHEPVLLTEVLTNLAPKKGESLLDATAGYGGHSSEILKISENYKDSVLIDRDQMAIDHLQARFTDKAIKIVKSDYYNAAKVLAEQNAKFDLILADLGLSSPHLNIASRGFSFINPGPLDMRMDTNQSLTAGEIVNKWDLEQLEKIIREYGEEPKARLIAKRIVAERPFYTTEELAKSIARLQSRWQKKHPATRTFQALRIAVNDELWQLKSALPIWVSLLKPGGRIVIISFHSLEDRIVKAFFAEHGANTYDAILEIPRKNPVLPSKNEIVHNPRSRSAKLRIAVKK
jgi:16S rRNA (cytosine1402-N4)-methyltransferase